jgi:hypothetical protein
MRYLVAMVALSLALAFAVARPVRGAQNATPAAGIGEAIDPAECRAEPRSPDEQIALWYAPDAAGTPVLAAPAPDQDRFPTSVPVPLGEPADAATVAAVTATVREIIACINSGHVTRAFWLFTDDLVRHLGPPPGTSVEDARAFLTAPVDPLPTELRLRLIAVTDVSVMADGRIGAIVIYDDPTGPPEGLETELLIFVEESGRWLVDGIAEFTVVPLSVEGTPAA